LTRLAAVSILVACLALGACAVGPNYKGPPDVAPRSTAAPAFHRAGDASADAPATRWWLALSDAELDRLVDAALAASPDLEVARARIVQARAGLRNARANQLPSTGASAAYLRSKGLTSLIGGGQAVAAGSPSTFQIYSASFDATWEIDLFGGTKRAIEGAGAQAQAADAALDGAEVSLQAEVAQAYVTLRQLQQRRVLTRHDIDIETAMLDQMRRRQAGGAASDIDVEQLNNQLQSTQADLTPIGAQISEQLDRLAMLTGREPGELDAELSPLAPVPAPPALVAVGDPTSMLRRRPDIRQAERQLQQYNAVIGQRTADLFPKVTLLGTIGYSAPALSQLLKASSETYAAAPLLQWTPFDFGRTRAKIAEARGAYQEALANYRATVLSALQDAETALSRFGRQRDDVSGLLRVRASAERLARLENLRRKGGTATTLDVLDTERKRVEAERAVLDASAQLTADYVALQKSLGLGWQASRESQSAR
jgi:NodT family efflux transporter outer membrane factor (OMF) lipoprotein